MTSSPTRDAEADVAPEQMERMPTGIPGFDEMSRGGLPLARASLVLGTTGSCKTLFACQCIFNGIKRFERNAVLVSFEETARSIIANVSSLGWNLQPEIDANRLLLIDSSPGSLSAQELGDFDLGGLLQQIRFGIQRVGAKLVVLDSLGTLFAQLSDDYMIRRELFRVSETLGALGITVIMTGERLHDYGLISRYGVEEFVSDCVVILRNVLDEEKTRRTIQILKMRGGNHFKGECPFSLSQTGIVVLPAVSGQLTHSSSVERVGSGSDRLDEIAGGGFFHDSIILLSGATGTGKTLLATTFTAQGCRNGERTLFLAFEESRPQLLRNAQGWGMGFEPWEEDGLLRVACLYPESLGLEEHMLQIREEIEDFEPKRLVIDSLSALERVGSIRVFREFVIGLSALVKSRNICTLLTSTTPTLSGGESITEAHISTLTDAIILLRYVELGSRLRRGLTVIKMRGSAHEKDVFEYTIGGRGIELQAPFKGVHGVILGMPQINPGADEIALGEVFKA